MTKLRWNELQNISRDIQLLTDYLLSEYKIRVWSTSLNDAMAEGS
jgi:hypothetical protein